MLQPLEAMFPEASKLAVVVDHAFFILIEIRNERNQLLKPVMQPSQGHVVAVAKLGQCGNRLEAAELNNNRRSVIGAVELHLPPSGLLFPAAAPLFPTMYVHIQALFIVEHGQLVPATAHPNDFHKPPNWIVQVDLP